MSLVTPRLQKYFKDYASHHKTPGNKNTHYFGITVIVISVLGLLSQLVVGDGGLTGSEFFRVDGGTILWAIGTLFYLRLDWKIALPFAFIGMGLYFIGRALPMPVNLALFVVGWILQYVGHYVYEKKSPAFYDNMMHLLIGPIWIFSRVIGYK